MRSYLPASASVVLSLGLAAPADASAAGAAARADRSTALSIDSGGHYTAKVTLDQRGPLSFVVDTGSQTSSLSQQVAGQYKFQQGAPSWLIGANGSQPLETVTVRSFRSDLFNRSNESIMLIPRGEATDAAGVLGMNVFTRGRIEFGFLKRELAYGPSRPTPEGYLAQRGTVVRDNFLIVDVSIDGVPAKAMIDTGGTSMVGNPALQAALGLRAGDPRLQPGESMHDVNASQSETTTAVLDRMTLGGVTFHKPDIVFAEFSIFHVLGLDKGPALIIGIDQLSHLEGLAIDFPRAELQLLP